jgi:hypothetical protein
MRPYFCIYGFLSIFKTVQAPCGGFWDSQKLAIASVFSPKPTEASSGGVENTWI